MTKRSPRIAVTLSPEMLELVTEVARLSKQPRSEIISELLDTLSEVLVPVRDALRVVESAPREAQRIMSQFANQATAELAQAQLDLDAKIDARTVKGKQVRRAKRAAES